jgi:hypothetical protein
LLLFGDHANVTFPFCRFDRQMLYQNFGLATLIIDVVNEWFNAPPLFSRCQLIVFFILANQLNLSFQSFKAH